MPRTNLASLLDGAATGPAQQSASGRPDVAGDSSPHVGRRRQDARRDARAPGTGDARSKGDDVAVNASKEAGVAVLPRYLQMERKELRLRVDQADELGRLTRRLNRARAGAGERITDNTLIRVAIDLLLQDSDRLAGATEDELGESVSQ